MVAQPFPPPVTIADRRDRGRQASRQTPPAVHADWTAAADRPDPVELLVAQNVTRESDLVPIRHGRMMTSPLAFYRGAATVMAADLARTPTADLQVQLCGDAHLLNFGLFDTPERSLVFGLNDFDETLPGPFEWDVKRFAASLAVAARDVGLDAWSSPTRSGPAVQTRETQFRYILRETAAYLLYRATGESVAGAPGIG